MQKIFCQHATVISPLSQVDLKKTISLLFIKLTDWVNSRNGIGITAATALPVDGNRVYAPEISCNTISQLLSLIKFLY